MEATDGIVCPTSQLSDETAWDNVQFGAAWSSRFLTPPALSRPLSFWSRWPWRFGGLESLKRSWPGGVNEEVAVGVVDVVGQRRPGVPVDLGRLLLGDNLHRDPEELPEHIQVGRGAGSQDPVGAELLGVSGEASGCVTPGSTVISMNTNLLPRPAARTSRWRAMKAPVTRGHSSWQSVRKGAMTMSLPR